MNSKHNLSGWPERCLTGHRPRGVCRAVSRDESGCPLLPPSQREPCRLSDGGMASLGGKIQRPARHFSHRGGSEESQGLQGLPSAQAALDYPFTSNFSPPLGGQRHSAPSGIPRARWQVKRGTPPAGRVTPARYFIFIVPMPW